MLDKLKTKIKWFVLRKRLFFLMAIVVPLEFIGPTVGAAMRYFDSKSEPSVFASSISLGTAILGLVAFVFFASYAYENLISRVKKHKSLKQDK